MNKSDLSRFWDKVDLFFGITDEDCWNWKAGLSDKGYGRINVKRKARHAHKLIYIHFKGEVRDDLQVMHTCNNPSCVNPSHLILGTNKDNQQYATLHGRSVNQFRPKLTSQEVERCKRQSSVGFTYQDIADILGCSRNTVFEAVNSIGAYEC